MGMYVEGVELPRVWEHEVVDEGQLHDVGAPFVVTRPMSARA